MHASITKDFPSLRKPNYINTHWSKKPDKVDDEEEQERRLHQADQGCFSLVLSSAFHEQHRKANDSLLLTDSFESFFLQEFEMEMIIHLKKQEVFQDLLWNPVPDFIRNGSDMSLLFSLIIAKCYFEGFIVEKHVKIHTCLKREREMKS